jgi:hypothetical protein
MLHICVQILLVLGSTLGGAEQGVVGVLDTHTR